MTPKVEFRWSWIYEQSYHSQTLKLKEFDYYKSAKKINDFISKIKKDWVLVEKKIFDTLSIETNLEWKEEKIICYVIKRSSFFPISDPLTIPIEFEGERVFSLNSPRFIDMLIHELIHNLFIQNEEKTEKYFQQIFDNYPEEEFDTIIHLIVHALHKKIFLKIFDDKRLKKEINSNRLYPAYKKSWEIVNKKGEDEIINEFKRFI
jgi:hypothetical protein